MSDLLKDAPAFKRWAAQGDALRARRASLAASSLEDRRRREQIRADYAAAVETAVEAGEPLPPAPDTGGNPVLDEMHAKLTADEMTHRDARIKALADSAEWVETEAAKRWAKVAPELKDALAVLDAARADLTGWLSTLADVRRAKTPDLHNGPADRTLRSPGLDDMARLIKAGRSPLEPTPAPRPVVDDEHDENQQRHPYMSRALYRGY